MRIAALPEALLPAVAALERAVFSEAWSPAALWDALQNPAGYWLAALDGEGRLLGYLGANVVDGEAEILRLAVEPDFRRQGLGVTLVRALLSRPDLRRVYLEVRASNAPARTLYARLGFFEIGRRKGYYHHPREDALVLCYLP